MKRCNRRNFIKNTILLPAVVSAVPNRYSDEKRGWIPLVAFRVGTAHWMTDSAFSRLLEFFASRPGAADELAFFTSATHPPLPLDEMRRRAERLATILPRVRLQGLRAGINVLATIGHHEENLPYSLKAPWQRMVDPWGGVCRGSFCPAHPELLDYARKVYTAFTESNPDFIWVDDDVRLQGHKPVNFTCFCDLCMGQFSDQVGAKFTRKELIAAFDSGTLEERLYFRREWLEHNRRVIDNLLRNIEEAAHKVKPELPLGFMTGDRWFEGYSFERWAKTLAGPRRAPVRWRPGGGFYSDEELLQLVDKANAMGRQVAALPPDIEIIESEVENFPYQQLRKSNQATVVEAAAYMAAGTTGTAFNVLSMDFNSLDEYGPLFRDISQYRPFYERLQSELRRGVVQGIWPAWNRDSFITANIDGQWLSGGKISLSDPYILGQIGVPLCYNPRGRTATALSGSAVFAFPQEELIRMFATGVLMDTDTWHTLKRLGLEKWTGVRAVSKVNQDATEVLSNHPINGSFAGWSRDCRQSFWWERAYSLQPRSETAEVLARIVDYGGQDLGPCMIAYTNDLGGRVVTMGYYPWSQIHSLEKSSQIKSVCTWLSRNRLPVVAESFAKVVIWFREGARGGKAIAVLNASLDPVDKLSLRVYTGNTRFTQMSAVGRPRELSGTPLVSPPGHVRVVLSNLEPWSIHLVVNGRA